MYATGRGFWIPGLWLGPIKNEFAAGRGESALLPFFRNVGFLYAIRRRRRITPSPTSAAPKIASDAGSGTCVVLSRPAFVNGVWAMSPFVVQGFVIGTFG